MGHHQQRPHRRALRVARQCRGQGRTIQQNSACLPDTGKHALFCYCFEQKRGLRRQWSPDGTREWGNGRTMLHRLVVHIRELAVGTAPHRSRPWQAAPRVCPVSTISPSFITRMRSASRMVDRRWAMIKLVRPSIRWSMAFWMSDLRAGIHAGGGLVEDQDLRVGDDGAGDGEQLLLALADTLLASSLSTSVVTAEAACAQSGPPARPWRPRSTSSSVAVKPAVADIFHEWCR